MKYIMEIRNPDHINVNTFNRMVSNYIEMMINYGQYTWTEVFETVNEWKTSLNKRERIGMVDQFRICSIQYEAMDFNPSEDYFYTSVLIKDDEMDSCHQGRGALVPRIYDTMDYDKVPYHWKDNDGFTAAFPAYTADDEELKRYGWQWFDGPKPIVRRPVPIEPKFVIMLDYIKKGGQ